jgi:hypothetical protein
MGGQDDARHESEELLRRALLDTAAAASVALKVRPLAMCEALTVIFHGRRDLGTIQTYVAHGGLGSGDQVGAGDLLRVPCDLDLGGAGDRAEAEELYAAQARALKDAIQAADTVLAVWREPLEDLAETQVDVDRSIALPVAARAPADARRARRTRAPGRRRAVCSARTLAAACRRWGSRAPSRTVAHVYPLRRGPEACLPTSSSAPASTPADGRAARAPGGVGRALPRAQRRRGVSRRIAVVAAAVVFLAVAVLIARWLQVDNAERAKIERLLAAQGRGDAAAMARELDGCDGPCQARVRRLAGRLERPGGLEIVRYDSQTARATGSTSGSARVVWRIAPGLPTVQCVGVRREGSALSGARVTLTALSEPIAREGAC